MKSVFASLLLLGALLAAGRLAAQETQPSAVPAAGDLSAEMAAIDDLSGEVAAIDERLTTWEKFLKALPKITGYMQLRYEYSDDASSFDLKRVRLNLQGDIVPTLDYRLQVEFASPKIVDAYVRFKPYGALNVQLGQFKIPFSIENTDYPPLKLETIEYPMALQRLMGFSEQLGDQTLKATGRDLGAQLYGGFFQRDGYSILGYNLGVFNGNGINAKDTNKSKDITARLTIRPIKALLLSGSYYWGEYGEQYIGRRRYGFGACYNDGRVVARAEWIGGKTGSRKSDGGYVLAGFRVHRAWQPVARFDTFRADADNSDSRETDYLVGLNWLPVKHLSVQLNYTCKTWEMPGAENRNVVGLMVTGMF